MRGSSSVAGNVGDNHRRHIIVVCRLLKARLHILLIQRQDTIAFRRCSWVFLL